MDITIQETPKVALGDLVFVANMVRGRKFQVVSFSKRQVVDGKEEYYPVALFDLESASIFEVYPRLEKLQAFLDGISYSVKSQKDYEIHLRRK